MSKQYEELWIRRRAVLDEMDTLKSMGKTNKKGHLSFSSNPKLAWQLQKLERELKTINTEIAESCVIKGTKNGTRTDDGPAEVSGDSGKHPEKKVLRLPK